MKKKLLISILMWMVCFGVYAQNQPPVFTSTPVVTVDDNGTYSYAVFTSDPDGDEVTITATTKPDWLTLTPVNGDVSTLAGSGSVGSTDGNGTSADFNYPLGVAVDATGNVYVADQGNHKIRKIAPNGDVSTLAGSGSVGSANGNGTSASFYAPTGVAVDAAGNVYVADYNNHKIRKISPNGDVSTMAGSGSIGSADGNSASASFSYPSGVAVDAAGNVYVGDQVNHKIRKIAPNGDVSTLAGSGSAGSADGNGTSASFNYPLGVAVDAAGNVYVADQTNHKIRKIAPNGDVSTLAGSGSEGSADGNGTSASFFGPYGVAVDAAGNVYVADQGNHKIRKIAPNGDVSTLAGSESAGSADGNGTSASFNQPLGVAVDAARNVYVADQGNHKIRKIKQSHYQLSGLAVGQSAIQSVTLMVNDGNGGTATQSFQIKIFTPDANNTLYVNKNGSGGNGSGDSWANAIPELADALLCAKSNYDNAWETTPLKIYVAKGTYKPMYSPEDGVNFGTDQGRDNSFSMIKNVQLYGGFAGTETALADRDLSVVANKTTLSGDIGTLNNTQDNVYHVVLSIGSVGSALLDGFKITNGNQTDGNSLIKVDGINVNQYLGAGMYNISSSPKIANVMFSNNSAKDYGGGMYNTASSPVLSNVILSDNSAGSAAGGMFNTGSSPVLINVTLSGNSAFVDGGISIRSSSSPKLYNTIVAGNTATNSPNIGVDSSTPDVQYSFIQGFNVGTNVLNGTIYNEGDIFTDPTNGDYSLKNTSPAANAGSNTLYTEAGGDIVNDVDLAGNQRIYNGTPATDVIDMGAYELQRDPIAPITPDANNILYVNKNVSGGDESGNSWTNAIPELADAMLRAKVYYANSWETTPLKIYVAKGTYKPMYSPEDGVNFGTDQGRDNSFSMIKNVQLYGGFAGTETALADRDLSLVANKTTLSGDFNDDDVVTGAGSSLSITGNTENAYHVLVSAGDMETARLDGFTITRGAATASVNINVNSFGVYSSNGGGMFITSSSPIITNNNFIGNSASYGGGLSNSISSSLISNSSFDRNIATARGGGLSSSSSSSLKIYNSTFIGNNANEGGAMDFAPTTSANIINSTFHGNKAQVNGDGIQTYQATVAINNSIIWNALFDVNNSSVAFTKSNSLTQGESGGSNGNIDATNLTDTDIFIDPANGYYSLKGTSPALNAGDNTLYTNAGGDIVNDVDLAGNQRIYNGTPATDVIDMGAYELQRDPIAPISPDANNILYVNKNVSGGDKSGDSWGNAIPELADAMIRANAYYNNSWATTPLKIFVAKGTYKPMYSPEDGVNFGTDQGRDNSFSMIKNVQLYGGFDPANGIVALTDTRILPSADETEGTILSGDIGIENDTTDNIYNVLVSAGEIGTASLDGFTITGGNANTYTDINVNGSQVFKCSGAGVYNSVSSPTYKNIVLKNNSCTESGGGMFSYMSSPKLQSVILKDNQAKDGGGMANQQNSSPTLLNVAIESNKAIEHGSGMYNVDESGPTLTNVSIVGNEATVSSAEVPGCVSQNSNVTLRNSIIWDILSGDFTAQNSLLKDKIDTDNGNIDATGLTENDIFNDPANGDFSLKFNSSAVNAGSNILYTNAGGDLENDLDLAANLRLNDDLSGTAIIDIGAYEFYKTDQVITFETLDNVTFGDANFTLAATSNSGLTITYTSANTEVATILGNEVTIIGAGSTTITASQAGNDNYNAATAVTQELTVEKATQVITFETLDNVTFGDANYTLAAASNSGLAITYTSANTEVATISGNEVTIIGAGSTTISASQAGNDNYNASTAVTQELTVEKATQVITFETLDNVTFGDANYTLAAASNSGLAITYTSANTEVATISGNEVTIIGAGSTTISASQAGNDNYNAATAVTQELTVEKANQTITFNALNNVTFGDANFTLAATSNSGLTITYTSANTEVATILGNEVTIIGAGSTTITASQAGNDNYNAATAVTQELTVEKATQAITFETLDNVTFGDANYTLAAATNSGLAITYTSANTDVATISGNEVSIVGAGSTTITASQAGNDNYNAATVATQELIVEKANQVITFNALANATFGDANFTLAATSNSGLAITYTSANTEVATISGNEVTIIGAGTTTITASQAGNENYNPATAVTQELTVEKATQVITFEALDNVTFGDANFTLAATSNSGLAITYTSSNTEVATISGNEVSIVGVGSTTITASHAGNDNYNAATAVTQVLTVEKANQTITFEALANVTFGDANFTLAATSNSGLAITYTSSNTEVATISGNEVSIVGVGSTTITAPQAGNDNYNAATAVTQVLTVEKANQAITFEALANVTFGDANFTLAASTNSGLAITYTSANTEVATISGNEVSIIGVGITTITASQAGNENYNAASQVEQELVVGGITASQKRERISVDLYPNPTSNVLHIKYTEPISTIQLFDAKGKAIETININNKEAKIEMMHYPSGLYFIQIDGLSKMYRFIKK